MLYNNRLDDLGTLHGGDTERVLLGLRRAAHSVEQLGQKHVLAVAGWHLVGLHRLHHVGLLLQGHKGGQRVRGPHGVRLRPRHALLRSRGRDVGVLSVTNQTGGSLQLAGGVHDSRLRLHALGEGQELLESELLRLNLLLLLNFLLEEGVLFNLLIEHDRDFVYLKGH